MVNNYTGSVRLQIEFSYQLRTFDSFSREKKHGLNTRYRFRKHLQKIEKSKLSKKRLTLASASRGRPPYFGFTFLM